jgi:nucleoside-diphosphate-sugar epimerase
MTLHVVVGAGPVGSATARLLAEKGERVRVITRRGTGPQHPAIERVAADAGDGAALGRHAEGAAAIYNCVNPAKYYRWATDWPPIAAALLSAAETSGAVLVTANNLYGYSPVDVPMTEDLPFDPPTVKGRIRARMWHDALAAHNAGRIRATEARASDYLGPGAQSVLTLFALPAALAGKRAILPADPDAPHTWTYPVDVARTLVALGSDERAWGKPWNVPSDRPASIRDVAVRAAALTGARTPRLHRLPEPVMWLASPFHPIVPALHEMRYQFERPFVLDSSRATATFGIQPTPLDEALRATLASLVPAGQASSSSSGLPANGSPSKSTME